MKKMLEKSCYEFLDQLASAAPVPGGGGASALGGALGLALGSMVGNLTLGKKKYANVQEDIKRLLVALDRSMHEMEALVQRDADVFEPLSKAYGMPMETEEQKAEKARVLEEALKMACSVPLEIMEKGVSALTQMEELSKKGTKLALSDVGVGVQFLRAAVLGASMNVYTNTRLMKDKADAAWCDQKADMLKNKAVELADRIFEEVEVMLR